MATKRPTSRAPLLQKLLSKDGRASLPFAAFLRNVAANLNVAIGLEEAIDLNTDHRTDTGRDDHLQYSHVDGRRDYTDPVGGVDPVDQTDFTTKQFLEAAIKAIETTTRITASQTLTTEFRNWFVNTDGGPVALALPAGADRMYFRVENTGKSKNDITVTPDGAELLTGKNEPRTLSDRSVVILAYETTEGWY